MSIGPFRLSHRNSGTALGHIAGIIAVAMWGYSFVASRVLLDNGLGPVQIYVLRSIIAYVLILLVCHKRLFAQSWRDEGLFVLVGMTAGSLYFIAENTALEYTLTTNVSLLTSMSPLLTAIIVAFLYRERLGVGMWIGSAFAVLGVACVVFNASASIEVRPFGDLLALAAAFSWGVYSIILKKLNAGYDVWFISRKTFFYGILTAILFLIFEHDTVDLAKAFSNTEVWGNMLFLGIGASLISYVLWAVAVDRLGAVKANSYMYFQSVVTLIVSAILLHEPITPIGCTGILLILGGLWLGENFKKLIDKVKKIS